MTYDEMVALSLEMQKIIPDVAIREDGKLISAYDGPVLSQKESHWTSWDKGIATDHPSSTVAIWYQGNVVSVMNSVADWETFKAFFVFCAEEGMLAQ